MDRFAKVWEEIMAYLQAIIDFVTNLFGYVKDEADKIQGE